MRQLLDPPARRVGAREVSARPVDRLDPSHGVSRRVFVERRRADVGRIFLPRRPDRSRAPALIVVGEGHAATLVVGHPLESLRARIPSQADGRAVPIVPLLGHPVIGRHRHAIVRGSRQPGCHRLDTARIREASLDRPCRHGGNDGCTRSRLRVSDDGVVEDVGESWGARCRCRSGDGSDSALLVVDDLREQIDVVAKRGVRGRGGAGDSGAQGADATGPIPADAERRAGEVRADGIDDEPDLRGLGQRDVADLRGSAVPPADAA